MAEIAWNCHCRSSGSPGSYEEAALLFLPSSGCKKPGFPLERE